MLNYTPEEYAQLDEQTKLLVDITEASMRGEDELSWALTKKLIIPAETLMAAKLANGADWIRHRGLRTETAEVKYGKDWLER